MAISIDKAYINTFDSNVRHLVQQKKAKLRDTVQSVMIVGKDHNWERLGKLEASEKASARTNTPEQDAPWSRRVSLVKTYHMGTTTEIEDPTKMLVDPNSNLAMTISNGMNRKVDDVIIAAATGTALTGDATNIALPGAQKMTSGASGANEITASLVADIQTKFLDNYIDVDTEKYAVVSPAVVKSIMNTLSATSSDYVQANALQQYGVVANWMGFNWRISNRLLAPEGGQINCLFYTKQALGLQINMDISAKMAIDPTKSFMWRLYSSMIMGAVRIEDEHMVQFTCKG